LLYFLNDFNSFLLSFEFFVFKNFAYPVEEILCNDDDMLDIKHQVFVIFLSFDIGTKYFPKIALGDYIFIRFLV